MSELYIPNSANLRNFDTLFNRNSFDFSDGKIDIRFHPSMVALHPISLAFYAAVGDVIKRNGWSTTAEINPEIHTVPFLQRMKLFESLGYQGPITFKEHEETGRFIPLMKITSSAELDRFIKTVDPILHTTRENSRVIKHVFSELLRNTIEHSNATGNVCATYNRKRRKVSIGISDAGVGILATMQKHHGVRTHREALLKALTPGLSGTTARIGGTAENAGAGLFFTKCIAQATRSYFLICSGDAYFKLRLTPSKEAVAFHADPTFDVATIREGLPFFPGTVVGLDLYVDDTEAFNRLIENIGDAYRLAVKKSQKDYYKRIKFT